MELSYSENIILRNTLANPVYLENDKPCLNLVHEVDFRPMSFKDRVIVAWNILTNKNFKFEKVSMDWD